MYIAFYGFEFQSMSMIVFFLCKQSTIKLLVAAGANVNLQTGSFRGNVSALTMAAAKGHLDVVKALVELKASPDKKGWS